MLLETTAEFKSIVLNKTPLIDVRSPAEFEKGSFLNAVNIPIMDNEQREKVGIEYKRRGNIKATELGYRLVSSQDKDAKIEAWLTFIKENPGTVIYCFRGGQRSQIAQQWIQDASRKNIKRLQGGYKAFRHFLIDELTQNNYPYKALRLGGCTGSGKTILLNQISNSIDLEDMARHRGSSFGKKIVPQPSQINFENNLAYEIIKKRNENYKHLVFEDEGKNVGRSSIPKEFYGFIHSSPLIILEVPFERRTEITFNEYVKTEQEDYIEAFGQNEGINNWSAYIKSGLERIQKRLGGALYQHISSLFDEALLRQQKTGDISLHKLWVASLLKDYYDPMYNYQLEQNKNDIIFKGNEEEILEYIKNLES